MNENSKVLLICSIIGLFGMIIAAVINKSDFSWPKKEKQTQSTNKVSKTVDNNQLSKISLIPVNSSPEKENNHEAVNVKSDIIDFDKSVFIFNNKRFDEEKTEIFLDGQISIKIYESSNNSCVLHVSQRIASKFKEEEYDLVNGSPLIISIRGIEYYLFFINGKYREYCEISSYLEK